MDFFCFLLGKQTLQVKTDYYERKRGGGKKSLHLWQLEPYQEPQKLGTNLRGGLLLLFFVPSEFLNPDILLLIHTARSLFMIRGCSNLLPIATLCISI